MTSDHRLTIALGGIGIALTLVAIGWWWLIFGIVVDSGTITYAQAATCLAGTTDLCALAQALCTADHWLGLRAYAPEVFWAGSALLIATLAQLTIRPGLGRGEQP